MTTFKIPLTLLLCPFALFGSLPGAQAQTFAPGTPVVLTAEQDHQRMLDLLHIQALRRGRDGSATSAYPANYDEAKANPYPVLPDPLVLNNGKSVKTAAVWRNVRRAQLFELFDREIYGRVPLHTPSVRWEVTATRQDTVGTIPVTVESLSGHVDNSSDPAIEVTLKLELTTPAQAHGPVPAMVEFGFLGPRPAGFPAPKGPSARELVIGKGWAFAVLSPGSVQADNGAGLTSGIIGLSNHGQPRKLDDWGVLRAWAWGASRVLDYLATNPAIDAKRVGIDGHSRYGKAALVTMAYEPRFAIAYVSSSGEGGAKLSRRDFGETIENVAGTGEYHWMAGNFLKYAGPLNGSDLPVDAHELIALCAPRPVFIGGGVTQGDGWVDTRGMFLAEVAAGPVYRLLGASDLGTGNFPPQGTALVTGDLGFRQHGEGHTPLPNWPTFLDFASRCLAPALPAARHL